MPARTVAIVVAGLVLATLALSAIVAVPSLSHVAYATPPTKKVDTWFDRGEWSYIILDPFCGVSGPFTVYVDIRKYHFALYEDGSYEESFNVRSEIIDELGTLVASSWLTSKYYTGSTSSLPLESMANYSLKCSQQSGEPGQVTSSHTRLIIGEDGSIVMAKGF